MHQINYPLPKTEKERPCFGCKNYNPDYDEWGYFYHRIDRTKKPDGENYQPFCFKCKKPDTAER